MDEEGDWGDPPPLESHAPAPLGRYFLGVGITVFAIVSQYFVPQLVPGASLLYDNLLGDTFVVYGVPVLAFALLVGGAPLRDWGRRMGIATWQGLRFYGLLLLLALVVSLVLAVLYEIIDPAALQLLNRPNPALNQAQGNPWLFVGFSFVAGAFEETIFRGFMFGYWRDRTGSWLVPATWTSAVFAAVHLYYATTYGIVLPLLLPGLFLFGFAMAATYRFSGGNLVVPALLHGAHDAIAFLQLVSLELAVVLNYLLILVGGLVGLIDYLSGSPDQLRVAGPPLSP
jgi:membrane protease YdiL (CAAX protease family)